jgi:serine/threonine protein kinase
VVAEDYRIEGRLGVGGMGIVYLARHQTLDRQVAIKELLTVNDEGRERLLREAMAMAKLDHPNVVRVFDARQLEEHLFIAMEYVAGGTLQQWSTARRRSVQEILDVFAAAADGLAAAHAQGIVHRDFKPQNVLMTPEGVPRVADFGIARAGQAVPSAIHPASSHPAGGALDSDLTATGSMLGTPAYMAPEQYEGRADARSDQFAFCVALYEALYSQRPYDGPTPAALWTQKSRGEVLPPPTGTDVPRAVFDVLRRGLDPSPERRFANLPRLVRALRRASTSNAPLIAAITVSAVLVLGGLSVAGWWLTKEPESPAEPSKSNVVAGPIEEAQEKIPSGDELVDVGAANEEERLDVPAAEPVVDSVVPSSVDGEPVALKKAIVCHDPMSFTNESWDWDGEGPLLIARDDCVFKCIDCTLSAEELTISALGNAQVELTRGTVRSMRRLANVREQAKLSLVETQLEPASQDTALFVEDRAELTLDDSSIAAPRCIEARDEAIVRLYGATVVGSVFTLRAGPSTTVQERGTTYMTKAPEIEGTREKIRRAQ